MEEYVLPIVFFVLIGAVIGVMLTFASKVLRVETDERQEKINNALPGANCGGCGYSGCAAYAQAVVSGEAEPNLCRPGGAAVTEEICSVMGIEAKPAERETAFVRCNGSCSATKDKFVYIGSHSCAAVEKFYNGTGECRSRCHGFGDCAAVCPNGCISIINGVATVDPTDCIGCGKCVRICPNSLITLVKESDRYMVMCRSEDKGKETRAICKNGCIACGLCARKCPSGAITLSNNHAVIDQTKCSGCGKCAQVCPVGCIVRLPECNLPAEERGRNDVYGEGEVKKIG